MIAQFQGPYRFLSNFWPSPVFYNGVEYPTAEHAYQASKSATKDGHDHILKSRFPGEAKRRGKEVPLRPDWESMKLIVMRDIIRSKFGFHTKLGQQLLDTGDEELQEGNNWGDKFWGVCRGQGENHLGRLLMEHRSELKARMTDWVSNKS